MSALRLFLPGGVSQKQSSWCPPPERDTDVSEFTAARAEYAHFLLRVTWVFLVFMI